MENRTEVLIVKELSNATAAFAIFITLALAKPENKVPLGKRDFGHRQIALGRAFVELSCSIELIVIPLG